MEEYFRYGETELSHLRRQDERLAEVIDRVGMVKRRVIPDLFAALVHTIVGQQISTRAHETIWQRIQAAIGPVTPAVIGSDRSLTGYGGGLAAKRWLLELESEPLLPFRDTFVK